MISCIGVHLPISHFTHQMEYYPPALPYIIIDKRPKKKRPQSSMTIEQKRSFITQLLQKLDRKFFFIDDFVVDITPHRNIFASPLQIYPSKNQIISLQYINEKEYLLVPRVIVEDYIEKQQTNNNIVDKIYANTQKLTTIFFGKKSM